MKRSFPIPLKYRLAAANATANLIGVMVVNNLIFRKFVLPPQDVLMGLIRIDLIFTPFAFLAVAAWTIWYEWPIYGLIDEKFSGKNISSEISKKARRRLLNYPFCVMATDLGIWSIAAIIYTLFSWSKGTEFPMLLRPIFISSNTGMVTATIVFFLTEHIIQRQYVPLFFPHGDLSKTPGTIRIRIGMRMAMVLIACNLIPLIAVLQTVYMSKGISFTSVEHMNSLYAVLYTNALLFMALGICVVWFVSTNMTLPFKDIIHVLKGIKNGNLDRKIQVRTNDEIGYTGEVINDMSKGLREREKMRQALNLAREVQLNLLPKSSPQLSGVDIAGKSIYCDQTGGDYFDYLEFDDPVESKIGLVVGDVSGHGISSALLMATTRAFFRLRSFMPGSIAQAVTDVNRQLSRDVGDSGQFMTLFYMVVDPVQKNT